MIDIIVSGNRGEGALKSVVDIVKSLEKSEDTYKIFVLDDERTLYATNILDNTYVITCINKENIKKAMLTQEKIILVLESIVDMSAFKQIDINANHKVYLISKSVK